MSSRFAQHHYRTHLEWSGSTGDGYRSYDRSHRLVALPGDASDVTVDASAPGSALTLGLTADPAFLGTPDLLNPEQLLLAAASSCQLLSFLAEAAWKRVDVRAYVDRATAVLDAHLPRPALTSILLRPRITVAPGTDHDLVRRLVQAGHEGCFIANSLAVEVQVEPDIVDAAS